MAKENVNKTAGLIFIRALQAFPGLWPIPMPWSASQGKACIAVMGQIVLVIKFHISERFLSRAVMDQRRPWGGLEEGIVGIFAVRSKEEKSRTSTCRNECVSVGSSCGFL